MAPRPPPRLYMIFSSKSPPNSRRKKKIPGVTRTQSVLGGGCIRFQVGIVLKRFFCRSVFTPVSRRRPARGAPVALSPLRCTESSPAEIGCIGFAVVNLPGAADWAQGLPGAAPEPPYSKHLKNDIAANHLLNGPQELFLTPRRSRTEGQEKSYGANKQWAV